MVLRVSSTCDRRVALVGGRHELRGERGDAREVAEEVQRRALGREDGPQRRRSPRAPCRPARAPSPSLGPPRPARASGPSRRKAASARRPAGQHAGLAGPQRVVRRGRLGHERGGEVAFGTEVLGQGAGRPPRRRRPRTSRRPLPPLASPRVTRRAPGGAATTAPCRGTRARAWAPRLSVRAAAEASRASATWSRLASSPAATDAAGSPRAATVSTHGGPGPGQRGFGADDAGAAGHGPLERVAQLGDVGRAPGPPVARRRRCPARADSEARAGSGVQPMPSSGSSPEHRPQRAAGLGPGRRRRRCARPGGPRRPCPRAASWRPGGWPRARRCRPPRPRPTGRAARWPPTGR